jgi:hypothetical protein
MPSNTYTPPRVTFVGSDPKIAALNRGIKRVALTTRYVRSYMTDGDSPQVRRFVAFWQARNRRTRVLMERVRRANVAA